MACKTYCVYKHVLPNNKIYNRMNNLTPIEWAVPLGLPMFFGEEQENK